MPDSIPVHDWFAVGTSGEVRNGQIVQAFLHGQELALWRTAEGAIQAWENRCPHRGTRLTMGRIVDDQLACAYHGWRFASNGQCAYIPAHPQLTPPKTVCARTYRAAERYGMVWVCLGEPRTDIPALPELADARRLLFCRSFVTYQAADRVIEGLLAEAEFGYRTIGPCALIGKGETDFTPILLVQPMAEGKSILHLWLGCERDAGRALEVLQRFSALVKRQRRRLEARA